MIRVVDGLHRWDKVIGLVPLDVVDQESLAAAARGVIKSAEAGGDDASADLGVRRLDVHQKNA